MPAATASITTGDECLTVLGERIRVLLSTGDDETGIELFEISGARESGPPPHRNDWHACFVCVAGRVEFTLADQIVVLDTGVALDVPAGLAHAYRLLDDDGKLLCVTNGGGRTLQFFRDMHASVRAAEHGSQPVSDIAARVCAQHRVELLATLH